MQGFFDIFPTGRILNRWRLIISPQKTGLSLIVIARNEAGNIAECLESASFADEMVVVDNGSQDDTPTIARRMGARVVDGSRLTDFSRLKSLALTRAGGEWVLSLDADERVTPELGEEIVKLLAGKPQHDGYLIPRRNYYFGKFLRFGGHYPDRQLRLMRREKASLDRLPVHESFRVEGSVGRLHSPLLHYTYSTIGEYFRKQSTYIPLMADNMAKRRLGRSLPARLYYLCIKPTVRFLRRYLFKLGFLGGYAGFLAAVLDTAVGISAYAEYLRLTSSDRS